MSTCLTHPPQPQDRHSERGLTLPEALIAITVFSVVFISALTLYSVASSAYLRTDSAVIQQQNIRFTMDKMAETLRDAGAGHNMLGSRRLADEQIEGTWESAVFVRGDFDGQRETDLEDPAGFPMVTTGNHEIVGFVLLKNGAGTIPITVKTDLTGASGKRDAVFTSNTSITGEESVTVNVAATTLASQTLPPYQLARVTFTPAGVPEYEIIAENIHSLSFTYASPTAAVASYGGADAERDERATIRRIGVRLVGMTDRPDLNYKAGTGTTAGFRTFPLEQTILAANLGIVGGPHNFAPPISLPTPDYISDCTGHCRQHYIEWAAAPGVTTYRLQIDAAAVGSLAAFTQTVDLSATRYEFQDPPDDITAGITRPFTFKVASLSGSTAGPFTTAITLQSFNDAASEPSKPTNVDAMGAASELAMSVTWTAVTNNIAAATATSLCVSSNGTSSGPPSPWNILAKDLTDSKVFRERSTGLNTGATASEDVSNQTLGTIKNAVSNTAFLDRTAAPCSAYFYRVTACDLCDVQSAFSDAMANPKAFVPPAGIDPGKPPAAPTPVTPVATVGTDYVVQLQWNPLIQANNGSPAATAHYVLERWSRVGSGPYTKQTEFDIYEGTVGPVDTVPKEDGSGNAIEYRYYVKGVYDCAPIREGALSEPYDLACTPPAGNTLAITNPVNADVITRPAESAVPLALTVGGTGWTSASIQVQDESGSVVHSATLNAAPVGSTYTFSPWVVSSIGIPDGVYTVTASAEVNSCRAVAGPTTFQIETAACGQRIINAAYGGTGSSFARTMNFQIENSCPDIVKIDQFTSIWANVRSNVRLTSLVSGSTTHFTGSIASNQPMTFGQTISLAAGTVFTPSVSSVFTFSFDNNFTSNGNQNGSVGRFTSIIGRLTSPTSVNEQLVDGATSIP